MPPKVVPTASYSAGETEILTRMARLEERIAGLERTLAEYRDITSHYVRREEFAPVRAVVYGLVSLILISVAGALIVLVVQAGAGGVL